MGIQQEEAMVTWFRKNIKPLPRSWKIKGIKSGKGFLKPASDLAQSHQVPLSWKYPIFFSLMQETTIKVVTLFCNLVLAEGFFFSGIFLIKDLTSLIIMHDHVSCSY